MGDVHIQNWLKELLEMVYKALILILKKNALKKRIFLGEM